MKALILSSLNVNRTKNANVIQKTLIEKLNTNGYQSTLVDLTEQDLKYCVGCGHCVDQKPGECILNDDYNQILPKIAAADLLVFLTSVSFGGYDSTLKKLLDRFMTIKLPIYSIHNRELHHKNRYGEKMSLMTVGVMEKASQLQEEIFRNLTERSGISFYSPKYSAVTLLATAEQEERSAQLIKGINEVKIS